MINMALGSLPPARFWALIESKTDRNQIDKHYLADPVPPAGLVRTPLGMYVAKPDEIAYLFNSYEGS